MIDINTQEAPEKLTPTILDILTWPESASTLHKKSEDIIVFDGWLEQLSLDLFATMKSQNGVGLAAPQVGIMVNAFAVWIQNDTPLFFANPKIIESGEEMFTFEEGCLSVPGYFEDRERPNRIVVAYNDITGDERELELRGLYSFAVQHEMDHLDGKLFVDDLSMLKRSRVASKVKKHLKKNK